MAWSSSDRRSRLPSDWPTRVAATKRRARGQCEGITLDGELRWHVRRCDGVGTDCDHDERGDNHDLANLRWLSSPCHQHKTQHESAQAQADRRALRKRPIEKHPGAL